MPLVGLVRTLGLRILTPKLRHCDTSSYDASGTVRGGIIRVHAYVPDLVM